MRYRTIIPETRLTAALAIRSVLCMHASMSDFDVFSTGEKMAETALAAIDIVNRPKDLGQALAALYFIDRTVAGGRYSRSALTALDLLMKGLEMMGYPVGHTPEYVWYLISRYGKMCAEASTPSKLELIYHAFYSEFSEEYAHDADVALFRDVLDRIDYNEACALAGLLDYTRSSKSLLGQGVSITTKHQDYHLFKSMMRKELMVVVFHENGNVAQIIVWVTAALERFAKFIEVKGRPFQPG